MSNQPKPTGKPCHVTGPSSRVCEHGTKSCEVRHTQPTNEWTVSTIDEWISLNPTTWRSVIVFEHNASLDAAKAAGWLSEEALDEYAKIEAEHQQLRAQLAAEKWSLGKAGIMKEHNATLAALTGRHNEVCYDYAKQLAAEREKVQALAELSHFFKSVIQSGESWTKTCQNQYKAALAKVGK